jgi:hypothetical protein
MLLLMKKGWLLKIEMGMLPFLLLLLPQRLLPAELHSTMHLILVFFLLLPPLKRLLLHVLQLIHVLILCWRILDTPVVHNMVPAVAAQTTGSSNRILKVLQPLS